MSTRIEQQVVVIGAGLTGPVLAIYLARQGHKVDLYERRQDPRLTSSRLGPSINITLCTRGLRVLDDIGAGDLVRDLVVPAYGRVVHLSDGQLEYQPYGNNHEALYSTSRKELNRVLLDLAERELGVTLHFEEQCIEVDFARMTVCFEHTRTGTRRWRTADRAIGADGVHSQLRAQLGTHIEIEKKHAGHVNRQLNLPANASLPWATERNALHIWPRGDYMLIAFPNHDGSFSCTLNLPLAGLHSIESIQTCDDLYRLFSMAFPDALAGIPQLSEQYFGNRSIHMVSLRCSRWSRDDKALLIGDAAHAFWPAYGQGANAALDDCAVFDQCLLRHQDDWGAAFAEFEELRRPHTDAMTRLSEAHFQELRANVADPSFLLRKRIERKLNSVAPDVFVPLYNRISFTSLPYADAIQMESWQRPLVERMLAVDNIAVTLDIPEMESQIADWIGLAARGVM